jgi:hypothetical protein
MAGLGAQLAAITSPLSRVAIAYRVLQRLAESEPTASRPFVTGFMQMQATTDIPGIPLEHAFAAGLLTKQFEGVAEQEPLVKKAVIVKTTDGGRILIG